MKSQNKPLDNTIEVSKKDKLKRRTKKILIIILIVILSLAILIFGTYFGLYLSGKGQLFDKNAKPNLPQDSAVNIDDSGMTINYNGETYAFNRNITNILCLGLDTSDSAADAQIGTNGQADALFLVALDTKLGKATVISISRDILAEVDVYSPSGAFVGTENKQICLSYAYGDGEEGSCENAKKSVSKLFYDLPINSYFAMHYSGISKINDAIGGVEVPEYINNYTKPTGRLVTVMGEDAMWYVKMRDDRLIESNSLRMERQMLYLKSFASKVISQTKSDITTPLRLYDTFTKTFVTNITPSKVTYLSTVAIGSNFTIDYHTVEGTLREGENYTVEMLVDQEKLLELVISVFYTKVQ